MSRDENRSISDLEELGFTVITTQRGSSRWECAVMLETTPAQMIASATGDTQLEAIEAAHRRFWPDGREAALLECILLLSHL